MMLIIPCIVCCVQTGLHAMFFFFFLKCHYISNDFWGDRLPLGRHWKTRRRYWRTGETQLDSHTGNLPYKGRRWNEWRAECWTPSFNIRDFSTVLMIGCPLSPKFLNWELQICECVVYCSSRLLQGSDASSWQSLILVKNIIQAYISVCLRVV